MRVAELVFWGSLGVTVYACAVYPALLALLTRWTMEPRRAGRNRGARRGRWPDVTLVIPADRDEAAIVERLKNAVEIRYPADRLEILVGCGGEEDLTELLARSFDDPRVRVLSMPGRHGRSGILNACIPRARGEIVILTQVRAMMRPDAVRRLARHFRNPAVGGVCGKRLLIDPTTGRPIDTLIWTIENFVKRREARLGALLGANGGIFAIRKKLFVAFPDGSDADDFLVGLSIRRQGSRLVYEDRAVTTEEKGTLSAKEFERQVRLGAGGFQEMAPRPVPSEGPIALLFWAHKALRAFCPALLIAALVSNACLSGDPFYLRCLLVHELFYLAALIGLFCFAYGRRRGRTSSIPATHSTVPRASVGQAF